MYSLFECLYAHLFLVNGIFCVVVVVIALSLKRSRSNRQSFRVVVSWIDKVFRIVHNSTWEHGTEVWDRKATQFKVVADLSWYLKTPLRNRKCRPHFIARVRFLAAGEVYIIQWRHEQQELITNIVTAIILCSAKNSLKTKTTGYCRSRWLDSTELLVVHSFLLLTFCYLDQQCVA